MTGTHPVDTAGGAVMGEAEPMSALPPKADMCGVLAHVCFGPKADIG
jgi:hypothetical protein